MIRPIALMMLAAAVPALAQESGPGRTGVNSAARAIFEKDWVLMNWALKFHDRDRDILLSAAEAQAAANAFRTLADTNGDGRVTRDEYRAARAAILARY